MKNVIEQLSNYKSVHLNKHNIKTHVIGVPLIIWAVALLLNLVSFDARVMGEDFAIGLASVVGLCVLAYYLVLHVALALMIACIFGPLIYSTQFFVGVEYPAALAIGVFIVGWLFQFIGHAFERAKPAFVDDINQLLIGPLFLIAELYFALGLDKAMAAQVHEKALEKRKCFEQSLKPKQA
ncbi:DUF962 domain-containing protein [Thalassotalea euphylliae]|uniref:DUF962 domain-containing protein n=1 Tax=Thalassotalea euphylliae TaxID=1655234 RepID=A0A3E0TPU1_9GAMM|nr:Mpo1-like protein [Thalassotalea euphylliae]REL26596.1 DUF962 domain-containing protein [Thalassotalea euphylliae]